MKLTKKIMISFGAYLSIPAICLAATSGPSMPWDSPLTTVRDSVTGTLAHIVITVVIVGTGLTFAMSEAGHGARRVAGVVLGGALALGAINFMTAVGFAGATF